MSILPKKTTRKSERRSKELGEEKDLATLACSAHSVSATAQNSTVLKVVRFTQWNVIAPETRKFYFLTCNLCWHRLLNSCRAITFPFRYACCWSRLVLSLGGFRLNWAPRASRRQNRAVLHDLQAQAGHYSLYEYIALDTYLIISQQTDISEGEEVALIPTADERSEMNPVTCPCLLPIQPKRARARP